MAKQQNDTPQPAPAVVAPKPDVNPDVAFREAWDANKDGMREILTKDHQVRGNIKPSQREKAQAILQRYGL